MLESENKTANFISRWNGVAGSERSNYQLFIIELCELIGLERPEPAGADHSENKYVFERHLKEHDDEAKAHNRFIDCYRKSAFIFEAKSVQINRESKGAKIAMRGAYGQALNYARSLPAIEGRPPFLITADVGSVIEVYSDFSRSGGAYLPFPDPTTHRISITDLADPVIRERLRKIWLDPMSLDPSRIAAKVTRDIATDLARLAKSLEDSGHDTTLVSGFLTRCLFTLFAEDIGLIPKNEGVGSFTALLKSLKTTPEQFERVVHEVWEAMDKGNFSFVLRQKLIKFNGKFFKDPIVLPLNATQMGYLMSASEADWTQVEPAIFGTLLERALDPIERKRLGAHYTPRLYVERLVVPTVIAPLRNEWENVRAAALLLDREGSQKEAQQAIREFHFKLCQTKVLDPACGSGNFLYVTMEHMKRIEGEILDLLQSLGVSGTLVTEGLAVDPHQFLGIELNPRAAAIAEMVLWIGYLQWHFRTKGNVLPPEPVLRDFHNIECRDAVLTYDDRVQALDASGKPLSRWDGTTKKIHPISGEEVPDDSARVPVWNYQNPRQANWPAADFVVGNPPFIGDKRMRQMLGDGYVDALRSTYPELPESIEFVQFWWHKGALLARDNKIRAFGLITTNSIRQTFNRRTLQAHMEEGLRISFAVPDHPWVENSDGAAVRIAMTVGCVQTNPLGILQTVIEEKDIDGGMDGKEVTFSEERGLIHADLRIGANVNASTPLKANAGISHVGMIPYHPKFLITPDEAAALGLGTIKELDRHIKEYRNGRDVTGKPRGLFVLDMFGINSHEMRDKFPSVYQWILTKIKPTRDQDPRKSHRENWWIFAEPRKEMRKALAGTRRYIATVMTAKHRVFQFLDISLMPDQKLVVAALEDAFHLAVLSSAVHERWAIATGSTLEDRPVYVKSKCFETFPFPDATEEQKTGLRALAEKLDKHRKSRIALHPKLTITSMYNVLETIRTGSPLTTEGRAIHTDGLVSVLKSLHDEIDHLVLEVYGWEDIKDLMNQVQGNLESEDYAETVDEFDRNILERLVDLNIVRAREESAGDIRWLRPAFQNPKKAQQTGFNEQMDDEEIVVTAPAKKHPWPPSLPLQIAAIATIVEESPVPLSVDDLATHFSGRGAWKKRLPQLVEILNSLGRVHYDSSGKISR